MTENEKLYLLIKFAILRGTEKNDLQRTTIFISKDKKPNFQMRRWCVNGN